MNVLIVYMVLLGIGVKVYKLTYSIHGLLGIAVKVYKLTYTIHGLLGIAVKVCKLCNRCSVFCIAIECFVQHILKLYSNVCF